MNRANRRRRLAALFTMGLCAYLTVATSRLPTDAPTCVESETETVVLERSFVRNGASQAQWQISAIPAGELVAWRIEVTPRVSLVYVPFDVSGDPLPVTRDAGLLPTSPENPPSDALDVDAGDWPSSGARGTTELSVNEPVDHVFTDDGVLEVHCRQHPWLCRDVRFVVVLGESDVDAFTLRATAIEKPCELRENNADYHLAPVH